MNNVKMVMVILIEVLLVTISDGVNRGDEGFFQL
jgi:hypothetical protein